MRNRCNALRKFLQYGVKFEAGEENIIITARIRNYFLMGKVMFSLCPHLGGGVGGSVQWGGSGQSSGGKGQVSPTRGQGGGVSGQSSWGGSPARWGGGSVQLAGGVSQQGGKLSVSILHPLEIQNNFT